MGSRLQIFNSVDPVIPWATNANRTLHPDDTAGDPIPITTGDGWQENTRPPARIMNYLQNNFSVWLQRLVTIPFCNFLASDRVGTADLDALCYDGSYFITVSGTNAYKGKYGANWFATGSLTSAANAGAFCISDTYSAIVGTANGLEYLSGSSWTQVLNATIGGGFAGGAIGLDSNGDRTIAFDINGVTRIAPTGVNGSWVAPTTPPSLGGTPSTKGRVLHVGGTKWFAVRRAATTQHLALSEDDGDTWVSKTLPAYTSADVDTIAYDPGTGRLVSRGTGGVGVAAANYSDDDGATWTGCVGAPGQGDDIYSCGGNIWIATSQSTTTASLYISTDNAENWQKITAHDCYSGTNSAPLFLMSSGQHVVSAGETGYVCRSLAILE